MSHTIIAKVVELLGTKSDISRNGTPYTLAEIRFQYTLKGKKTHVHMVAFDLVAKSLKYFEKGSVVEVQFSVATKVINAKPYTGCTIEKIKRVSDELYEEEDDSIC